MSDSSSLLKEPCARCLKSENLCVCAEVQPLKTRVHVLILQHPQEPDKDLGSARLANLALPNSTLKIGLSWPNLKAALGRETQASRWVVLYLGSGAKGKSTPVKSDKPTLQFVDRKGVASSVPISPLELDGIIVLDGTWSQAKALWWRNPWLLKCRRAVLHSPEKSLYRELRKEPRRECLSTIESIADGLTALGEKKEVAASLKNVFSRLLDRKREQMKAKKEARTAAAAPKPPRE